MPGGVVPAGERGRQGRFDDVGLGTELSEVPVEGLAGLADEFGVPGPGALAGGIALTADPAARVGEGLLEFLVHAGLGEVDGAAVRGGGAGQVLEHAPDLVVEPLLHGPAGRVPRHGLRGLSGLRRRCGGRGRWRGGGLPAGVAVVDGAATGGRGRVRGTGSRAVCRLRSVLAGPAGLLPAVRRRYGAGRALGCGAALVRAEGGGGRLPGAVAVGGAGRRCLHGAGEALRDRLVDAARELRGLGQALVGEEFGQAAGVSLAHGAHLPGALPPVELQRDHGRLGRQAGDGVAGDLLAVQTGHGDERGRRGTEPGGPGGARRGGQGDQHTDAVDRVRHGVQIHREPVVGGRLPGHLETGLGGGARVGHPPRPADPAVLVAERGRGHDRRAGRDPDLQTGLGERVVLPPHQLGRHRLRPPASRVMDRVPLTGPATGPVSPRMPRGPAGSPASGPGRCGRWPGCPGPSSSSPSRRGAPWP